MKTLNRKEKHEEQKRDERTIRRKDNDSLNMQIRKWNKVLLSVEAAARLIAN